MAKKAAKKKKAPVKRKERNGKVTVEEVEAEILKGPNFQGILIKRGLTKELAAEKLQAEIEALTTKFFAKDGTIEDQVDVIDWKTRQVARRELLEYLGENPRAKIEVGGDPNNPIQHRMEIVFVKGDNGTTDES